MSGHLNPTACITNPFERSGRRGFRDEQNGILFGIPGGRSCEQEGRDAAHTASDYQAWLRRARQPVAQPPEDVAARGEQLFMAKACVLCHSIASTEAHGRVGPDLTHVGSRLGIVANTLPNEPASLEAWVTHAQSLKPVAHMPNISAFDGDELRAVVEYLRELK